MQAQPSADTLGVLPTSAMNMDGTEPGRPHSSCPPESSVGPCQNVHVREWLLGLSSETFPRWVVRYPLVLSGSAAVLGSVLTYGRVRGVN